MGVVSLSAPAHPACPAVALVWADRCGSLTHGSASLSYWATLSGCVALSQGSVAGLRTPLPSAWRGRAGWGGAGAESDQELTSRCVPWSGTRSLTSVSQPRAQSRAQLIPGRTLSPMAVAELRLVGAALWLRVRSPRLGRAPEAPVSSAAAARRVSELGLSTPPCPHRGELQAQADTGRAPYTPATRRTVTPGSWESTRSSE